MIEKVKTISFKGKIIDSHAHIGKWQGQNFQIAQLDTFIKNPLSNGDTIEKVLVSNLSAIDKDTMLDETDGNLELLNIVKSNPKIAPLAVCQPKTGSVTNIEKLFEQNPNSFIGLKFHPDGHEIMATDSLFNPYLNFAQKHKLPCLFHCGIAWENGKLVDISKRYSSPDRIYEAAKKIPNTPVILAHLGGGGEEIHHSAINVLLDSIETGKANLYADISWVDINNPKKPTIIELIKKLQTTSKGDMTNRILFGSDAPIGEFAVGKDGLSGKEFYEKTVVDIKTAIKENFPQNSDELIDKIFYKNADNLFFKRTWANTKKISKNSKVAICGLGVLAIICSVFFTVNKIKNLKTNKNTYFLASSTNKLRLS